MAVQGSVREPMESSKDVGFFQGKVVAVNPDREKLEELLGIKLEKDPEYLGEDDEGITKFTVSFWLQDTDSKKYKNVKFFLKDAPRVTGPTEKDPEKKKKKQYINDVGITTWADKEENLQEWFTKRDYRVAYIGEEELYKFLRDWLGRLDTSKPKNTLSLDFKKLMRGNVREITEQMGGDYEVPVTCLSVIQTVEKDGEKVEYEKIYNREFLPGYCIKDIKLKKLDKAFIENAQKLEGKKRNRLQKFVLSVTDPEFGCRDYFILGPLEQYDPTKNTASPANDATIVADDTSY